MPDVARGQARSRPVAAKDRPQGRQRQAEADRQTGRQAAEADRQTGRLAEADRQTADRQTGRGRQAEARRGKLWNTHFCERMRVGSYAILILPKENKRKSIGNFHDASRSHLHSLAFV